MDRYRFEIKIGDIPFQFECWDDTEDFMEKLDCCYYISKLSKELPIEILEKKLIKKDGIMAGLKDVLNQIENGEITFEEELTWEDVRKFKVEQVDCGYTVFGVVNDKYVSKIMKSIDEYSIRELKEIILEQYEMCVGGNNHNGK